jgi:hypothetical protein
MGRRQVERRLRQVGSRLRTLRDELQVADEQLPYLADEAEDMRTRALVADTGHAGIEARQAAEHLDAMRRHRAHVLAEIADLESKQDRLLDELTTT